MVSAYYGNKLQDVVLQMYTEDVRDIPIETIVKLFAEYRQSSNSAKMPMPGYFIQKVRPSLVVDDRAEGLKLANRIVEAITKFGWNNGEQAKEFLGDLCWRVVQSHGGWMTLCENHTAHNAPIMQAQWRDLLTDMHRQESAKKYNPNQIEIKTMVVYE